MLLLLNAGKAVPSDFSAKLQDQVIEIKAQNAGDIDHFNKIQPPLAIFILGNERLGFAKPVSNLLLGGIVRPKYTYI